jgi:PAS domain S-box-containing protein
VTNTVNPCCEILEYISDAVFSIDRSWKLIYLNNATERFFQRSREELLNAVIWDAIPAVVQSQLYLSCIKSIKEQSVTFAVDFYPDINKWGEATIYPSPSGAVIFMRDITAQQGAETVLCENEERLRLAIEAAGIGTWSWDTATGIQSADAWARKILGLLPNTPITADMVMQSIHPDDRKRVNQAVHEAIAKRGTYEAEFRVIWPNGDIRWVQERGRVVYDAKGHPLRLIGIVMDITERKQRELLDSALRRISSAINSGLKFEEIVQTAIKGGMEALGADVGLASFKENEHWTMSYGQDIGEDISSKRLDGRELSFTSIFESSGETIVVEDAEAEKRLNVKQILDQLGIRSAVINPQVVQGEITGALLFGYKAKQHKFIQPEIDFATRLSASLSLAIANSRLMADLDKERRFIGRILNTLPVVVTYVDANLVFRQANEAAAKVFGHNVEDIVGSRISEIVSGKEAVIQDVKTVFRTGKPLHTSMILPCFTCKEPEERYYNVTYVPDIDNQGRVVGVIQEAEDITEIQRLRSGLEEALSKAEATSRELHQSLDRERQYSVMLQRALLPETPEVPKEYEVATKYISPFAGREIGGDFYDVFETEGKELAILIGDVAGKGLEAASIAAATRATVRAFAYEMADAGEALTHANAVLHSHRPTNLSILFVTLFLGILDPETGSMRYCSAGHPPPAVLHASTGKIKFLRFGDPPVGLLEKYSYHQAVESIYPGDKIIFYTDGISEARKDTDLFGERGIERSFKQFSYLPPEELADKIIAKATAWAGGYLRDDAAVIVLERKSPLSHQKARTGSNRQ